MADVKELNINSTTYDIKAKTVVNQNGGSVKMWTGTRAQYDAITTKDSNTLYNVTGDTDISISILQTIYPVGSVYLSTNSTCPLSSLFGTWTLVSSGRALWTGTGSNGGSTISAGLPNISGSIYNNSSNSGSQWSDMYATDVGYTGALSPIAATVKRSSIANGATVTGMYDGISFDASLSNSIYGNSTTVQPPAYVVNVWRRTA